MNSRFIAGILILLLAAPLAGWAASLPRHNPVPGGIARVPLPANSETPPEVYFQQKRVLVMPSGDTKQPWVAITGIPLEAEVGTLQLTVKTPGGDLAVPFKLKAKKYKTQHLKIKNKRQVNPNKEDLERIGKETKDIEYALALWTASEQLPTPFVLPVQGKLSSPFGLRRFFNQEPRKPHSGIDIAAAEGTRIVAPMAGKVISTGDYFFNGNTLFLDHGNGLVTMYCHMATIAVQPGQTVAQGDPIGTVGKSGRVTGPHLHWSVSLNDARVDPGLFFDDIDKHLARKK